MMINKRLSIIQDVLGLFYPRVCGGCDSHLMKHEQNLCLSCIHGLPKTYFWDYDVNPIEKLFWGKLEVSSACAFLHFEKDNVVQRLMHRFKYQGKSEIGTELGRLFASTLIDKNWFTDVDVIMPIPLHSSKEQRRGYNQSAYIATGMGEVFDVAVRNNGLTRTVASESQTRKSRFDRTENVESVFQVDNPNYIKGKNVLLVDDVVTTGATLEAAGLELKKAGIGRLYIATIAVA
ncbi:MAG: ComF family protein [Flavobacteriales bacterium]